MRKKLTIIALLFCFVATTNAQSPTSASYGVNTLDKLLHATIKEYQYPKTICCYKYDTADNYYSAFTIQDHQLNLHIKLEFLRGYVVNDFEISNDSVFFCGYTYNSNEDKTKGIVGFFNINDFFFDSGSYFIQDNFVVEEPNYGLTAKVERLTKLVTYIDNSGERHIVCIGYSGEEVGMKMACMVDMYKGDLRTADTTRPITPWTYITGLLNKSEPRCLRDIVIAGNWIVTAGFENQDFISLRTYNPNNIFQINGTQDNVFVFSTFSPGYPYPNQWDSDELLLAVLKQDTIAAATTWDIDYLNFKLRQVNIARFRLYQLNGTFAPTMISLHNLDVTGFPNVARLHGFTANIRERKMALLFEGIPLLGDKSSIFLETNYKLTLTRACRNDYQFGYDYDAGLGGFDKYNNNQYIMAGRVNTLEEYYTFRIETAGLNSTCQPLIQCKFCPVPEARSETILNAFHTIGAVCDIKEIVFESPRYDHIETKCEN